MPNDPPILLDSSNVIINIGPAIQDISYTVGPSLISIAHLLDVSYTYSVQAPTAIAITYTDSVYGQWEINTGSEQVPAWTVLSLPVDGISAAVVPVALQLRFTVIDPPQFGQTHFKYRICDLSAGPGAAIYSINDISDHISVGSVTARLPVDQATGIQHINDIILNYDGIDLIQHMEYLFSQVDYKTADTAALLSQYGDLTAVRLLLDAAQVEFTPVVAPEIRNSPAISYPPVLSTNIQPITIQSIIDTLSGDYISNDFAAQTGILLELSGSTQEFGLRYKQAGDLSWQTAVLTDSTALLLDSSAVIQLLNINVAITTVQLRVRAWNVLAGTTSTIITKAQLPTNAYSSGTATIEQVITRANAPPVLDNAAPVRLSNILEDSSGFEITVTDFFQIIGGIYTEPDYDNLRGIAVTGIKQGTGTWEFYSPDTAVWTDLSSTSEANAVLLPESSGWKLRYIPAEHYAGEAYFLFKAWDQTAYTAGSFADTAYSEYGSFSQATAITVFNVTPVNHAPFFTSTATYYMKNIPEDIPSEINVGITITQLLTNIAADISDIDTQNRIGIAIADLSAANGQWEYKPSGSSTWAAIQTCTPATALLLDPLVAGTIRFAPGPQFVGTASFGIKLWDQTAGATGDIVDTTVYSANGSYSPNTKYIAQQVTYINRAPVILGHPLVQLPVLFEDIADQLITGISLADVRTQLGIQYTDVDASDDRGFALMRSTVSQTSGIWQWKKDGTAWQTIDFSAGALLLFATTDYTVRFKPAAHFTGFASLIVRAWDNTDSYYVESYNPAVTFTIHGAYSSSEAAILQLVQEINHPPTLQSGQVITFDSIYQDPTEEENPGLTTQEISTRLSAYYTDINTEDPRGFAVSIC